MGTLSYGTGVEVEVDDRSLAHLDYVLRQALGAAMTFQLHVHTEEAGRRKVLALTIGNGVPLALAWDDEHIRLDQGVINHSLAQLRSAMILVVPFPDEG